MIPEFENKHKQEFIVFIMYWYVRWEFQLNFVCIIKLAALFHSIACVCFFSWFNRSVDFQISNWLLFFSSRNFSCALYYQFMVIKNVFIILKFIQKNKQLTNNLSNLSEAKAIVHTTSNNVTQIDWLLPKIELI